MNKIPSRGTTSDGRPFSHLWRDTRPAGDRGHVTFGGSRHAAVRNAWGEVWVETTDGAWFLSQTGRLSWEPAAMLEEVGR